MKSPSHCHHRTFLRTFLNLTTAGLLDMMKFCLVELTRVYLMYPRMIVARQVHLKWLVHLLHSNRMKLFVVLRCWHCYLNCYYCLRPFASQSAILKSLPMSPSHCLPLVPVRVEETFFMEITLLTKRSVTTKKQKKKN